MRATSILFLCFLIHAEAPEYFKNITNFDSQITINGEDNLISSGEISFRNGNFVYLLTHPFNQLVAGKNGKIYVQDDDFKQVMIYQNDNSFFLQELFNNKYDSEDFPCPDTCLKLKPDQNSTFKQALVSIKGESLDWIRLLDLKDERIFIKFENFKIESSNISYVVPQNYEIINND